MRRLWVAATYTLLALSVAALGAYLAVAFLVEQGNEVAVPAVTMLSLSDALDELAPAELELEIMSFEYSDLVPENHIVRQRPLPDRVVKSGRGVSVVVSRGPERHPLPDVRGLPQEDALILLGEAGLQGRTVATLRGPPRGEIIALGTDPGMRLPRGTTIDLVVSAGPRAQRLRMPRLEGLTAAAALAMLDQLELRVARVEEVHWEDPTRRGRVTSQDPLPGFPVTRGQAVILAVAGANPLGGGIHGVWIHHPLPTGFSRHRVELLVQSAERSWVLADEWLPGGSVFRRWVPLAANQTIALRVDGESVLPPEDLER